MKYEIKCIKCYKIVPFQMIVDERGEWYCWDCFNKYYKNKIHTKSLINKPIKLKTDDPNNWWEKILSGKTITKSTTSATKLKKIDNSKSVKPIYRIHVDYALHGKVGIHSNNPHLRLSLNPSEISEVIQDGKINWQIEGEALAIKMGVYYFLKEINQPKSKLIIYTDCKTLLYPFKSQTKAGKWWREARILAWNRIKLEIRFVCGMNNPADKLTRSKQRATELTKRDKNYYYQQWLANQK